MCAFGEVGGEFYYPVGTCLIIEIWTRNVEVWFAAMGCDYIFRIYVSSRAHNYTSLSDFDAIIANKNLISQNKLEGEINI